MADKVVTVTDADIEHGLKVARASGDPELIRVTEQGAKVVRDAKK